MKKIFILSSLILSAVFSAQTLIPAYQTRANSVSQTNLNNGLQEFVNLGVKTTGNANNNNAFVWLQTKYASFGYTASQMSEDIFTYNGNQSKNLIVTKTGTTYPNTFVIVCSHYDTKNGVGANDNGSGTNTLLEIARILKNVPTEYSIKFIHFSGEEQGLVGSNHYVNNVVNATSPKMDIRVVFNIDQVGGRAGQNLNSIVCERDTNNNPPTNNAASSVITQELMNCVSLYSPLTPTLSYAYASDYIPFQNNNEVITGFYEQNGSSNPHPHTVSDIISNMDPVYLYNVTKAATGAVQHFAVASSVLSTDESNISSELGFTVSPSPAREIIELTVNKKIKDFTFTVTDMSGKLVKKVQNKKSISVADLPNGTYIGSLESEEKQSSLKFIVKH